MENRSIGDYVLDSVKFALVKDDIKKEITRKEYQLLSYFIDNPKRLIKREELFDHIYGKTIVGSGTLDVHMFNLRKKLVPYETSIQTIKGIGFIYTPVEKILEK